MIGIRLTKNDDGQLDMLLEDGKFVMAEDGEAVASALALAMATERKECEESPIVDTVTNPFAGIDFYGIVWDVSKSKAEKILELKRAMLAVPFVEKIIRFQWSQSGQTVTISAAVQTAWGEQSVAEEVTAL